MNDDTSSTAAAVTTAAASAAPAAKAARSGTVSPIEPDRAQDLRAQDPRAQERSSERPQERGQERATEGWIARLMGAMGLRNGGSLRENLESALAAGPDSSGEEAFTPEERMLLRNILRLRTLRVEDVMIPRADIVAADAETPLAGLIRAFLASGHSRMPIYRESLDDPLGMVHIKDLMALIASRASQAAGAVAEAPDAPLPLGAVDLSQPVGEAEILRPVLFVPPSMPASDLIARMKADRMQIALVIDEYGGTDGLVTLEDLIETVLGDIEDEHDQAEEAMIAPDPEGGWIADARIDLDELAEVVGPDLNVDELEEEDVDTLGGLIYTLVGRIPQRGEHIAPPEIPALAFEILDADPRRVSRVRVYYRHPRDGEQQT